MSAYDCTPPAANVERVADVLGGVKDDGGKTRWDVLPWRELEQLARVVAFGAGKYAPHNWKVVSPKRYFAATHRHLAAWAVYGPIADPETGQPQLMHTVCDLLFLAWHDAATSDGGAVAVTHPPVATSGGFGEPRWDLLPWVQVCQLADVFDGIPLSYGSGDHFNRAHDLIASRAMGEVFEGGHRVPNTVRAAAHVLAIANHDGDAAADAAKDSNV